MQETQKPNAERYRDTAEQIRSAAQRTRSPEIRIELFDLADRYDRLAMHAKRRDRYPDWSAVASLKKNGDHRGCRGEPAEETGTVK